MKRIDFLQRLIGITGFGLFRLPALVAKRKIFLQQFFVAGFRHYRGMELLSVMQENDLLELRREPENIHDECAIALYWQQEKIGFVPAAINEMTARLMDTKALPLLAGITHLNREVKPWENVNAAIYFLQDVSVELHPKGQSLQYPETPLYKTASRNKEKTLYEKIFDDYRGVVQIDEITIPNIRQYFKKHYDKQPYTVYVNGKKYAHISTNDIYTYLYNVQPIETVTADNGQNFVRFIFTTYPYT